MNALERIKQIRFEMWVDDTRKEQRSACAFKIDFAHTPEEEEESKKSYWTKSPGLSHIWFVLEENELNQLCRKCNNPSWSINLEDGYHRLNVQGEWCTFFDFEFPREDYGRMSIPYARLELPKAFWRYLARIARFVWKQQRAAEAANLNDMHRGERLEIQIPIETLARFQFRYGQGKGKVDCNFSERLQSELVLRPQLREKVEQVKTIARNTTRNVYETARVNIQNDMDGYFWNALTPKGYSTMHGGIVQHSKDPAKDNWSIHT